MWFGPCIAMTCALMTGIDIPWGSEIITIFGKTISLQILDIDMVILYFFAITSVGVYGIMIGGWASNNKFLCWELFELHHR
jgi:NADH-quinone oxidoreductase subunit H